MRRKFTLLVIISLLLVYLTFFAPMPTAQGGLVYQKTWGGLSADVAQAVTLDSSGNLYVTGYTYSFGAGGADVFLLKLNSSSGDIYWQRTWGGPYSESAQGVAVDSLGNVYVTGYTNSFGAGGNDFFLLKFNPNGSLIWQRTWGSASDDIGQGIAVNPSGDIYLTGYTYGSNTGYASSVLLKFNSTGALQWQRTWGAGFNNLAQGVTVDYSGNIYVTGSIFRQGVLGEDQEATVLKFNAVGTLVWQKTWGGQGSDSGRGIATDRSGNIYVGGTTSSFGSMGEDAFLIRLSPSGILAWQKTWGGGGSDEGLGVTVDPNGYIYMTGSTTSYSVKQGIPDVFLLQFDYSGNVRWQAVWGGTNNDAGLAVAADPAGYGIVAGYVSEDQPYTLGSGNRTLGRPEGTLGTPSLSAAASSFPTSTISGILADPSGSTSYSGGQDGLILKYGAATFPNPPRSASAVGQTGYVGLSWVPPSFDGFSPITGYRVYRGIAPGGESLIATLGTATAYNDTYSAASNSIVGGTKYYYYITALNAAGESIPSSEVNATPVTPPTLPQAPFTISTVEQVSIFWSSPKSNGGASINGYNVYRGTATHGETLLVQLGPATSYNDTGVTGGTTYFYYITALNSAGESVPSSEVSATPTSPPSSPQNLQAFAVPGQVTLTWSAPLNNGGSPITGYNIYRGTSTQTETLSASIGNTLNYIDSTVQSGTTYYYYVAAVNSIGIGLPSSEVTATPPLSPTFPSAPRNLIVTAGNASITLNWELPISNGSSEITGYKIYRSTSSLTETVLTSMGNFTDYADTQVTPGTTYYYRVSALNAVGEGGLSNEAYTLAITTPSSPRNLQINTGGGSIALMWTTPSFNGYSAITGYRIYRGTGPANGTLLASIGNQTFYVDSNVVISTHYYYNITAVNSAGQGAFSAQAFIVAVSEAGVPSAPFGLKAVGGNSSVTLTWTTPVYNGGADISGYKIYRGTSAGYVSLIATVSQVNTYLDTNAIVGGVTYWYNITAVNIKGDSASSNQVSATPTSGPSPPQNLVATGSAGQVKLTWTVPIKNGGSKIIGYRIFRGASSGTEVLIANIGNQTSYTDNTVAAGTTYYYEVKAYNIWGNSTFSNEAIATTPTPPPPNTPPTPPIITSITPTTTNITISWNPPSSDGGAPIEGYQIWRGTSPGQESAIDIVASTVTSYTDKSVTGGTTYYYEVKAFNNVGTSNFSNEVSSSLATQQITPPSAPQNFHATVLSSGINLTWTAPTNTGGAPITGYSVYRGTTPGAETWLANTTDTFYLDTAVTAGQTYYYQVRAINSAGASSFSNEEPATATAAPPTFPYIPIAIAALVIVSVVAAGVIIWRRRVSHKLMQPP